MTCVDGGAGLLAALPISGIPVRRCWAHKIRNILDKIRKADQPAAQRAIHKVMNAPNAPAARAAARRFADRFKHKYPNAVACLRSDLGNVLGASGQMAGWVYETTFVGDKPGMWMLGWDAVNPYPTDTQVSTTTLRHGNFDYVTNTVKWDPAITN